MVLTYLAIIYKSRKQNMAQWLGGGGGGGGGGGREEETKKRRKNERERESVCMQTERESACGLLSGYDVCLCTSMYVHACVHVHL